MESAVGAVDRLSGSSNELGAFESGLIARLMGTVIAMVFGGSMTLITANAVSPGPVETAFFLEGKTEEQVEQHSLISVRPRTTVLPF